METKYITVPFDLERAKRITNGEEKGKIIRCDGRKARIICFDANREDNIVALVDGDGVKDIPITYYPNGALSLKFSTTSDLLLSVPERTTFKNGDIVFFGSNGISIIKKLDYDSHSSYFTLIGDSEYFDGNYWINDNMRTASEDEKNKVFNHLKSSIYPLAKEYLKRFFPEHSNSENIGKDYKFEPKQWVLTRYSAEDVWKLDIFSHTEYDESEECYHYYCVGGWNYECVPYNLETKHLLGTTKDWEG